MHFIRKRHTKVCPVFYMKRVNDYHRLGLPLSDTQKRKGITELPASCLYDIKEKPIKRKEFNSFIPIAFSCCFTNSACCLLVALAPLTS